MQALALMQVFSLRRRKFLVPLWKQIDVFNNWPLCPTRAISKRIICSLVY